MTESGPPGPWRKAASHARWVVSLYASGGILWLAILMGSGSLDSEVSWEWMCGLVLISAAWVFACAFVVAGAVFALRPLNPELTRPWRAGVAGLIAPALVYSGVAEKAVDLLLPLRHSYPWFETLPGGILVLLTPFSIAVTFSLAASWALPPWRGPRLP